MPLTPEIHRYGHLSGYARESAQEIASLRDQISESKMLIQKSKLILAQPDAATLRPVNSWESRKC